ncbi:hypothetical protein ACKWTF_015817 [Chironomus riparius]
MTFIKTQIRLAALMTIDGKFFCGGSLITSTKVVSGMNISIQISHQNINFILLTQAAHCILQKNNKAPMLPRDLKVLLGVHDLDDSMEAGRVTAIVRKIHIHPDWNPFAATFDADIAVLELENEVQFSVHIQPICLIDSDSRAAMINHGVIVGYGKSEDESKDHEKTPKSLESPVIYHRNCSENYTDLVPLLSNRAFCGGNANGTGTCTGDSGSGLYVKYAGTYYLRGIVSSSLMSVINDCNTAIHSVLTDVLNFNEWITFDTIEVASSSNWSINRLKSFMNGLTQSLSENAVNQMIKTLQEILIQKQKANQVQNITSQLNDEHLVTKEVFEYTTMDSSSNNICSYPQDEGSCDEYVINYSYDKDSRSCRAFYYGGCGGSPNRFETSHECESACVNTSTERLSTFEEPNNINIPSDCTDNKNFANCELIVRGKYCNYKYYGKFCCRL